MIRDKIAELLADLWYQPDGLDHHAAADAVLGLLRECPITETVDRYDGMTSTTTDRVNRYAMVPLPEEDE